MRILTVAFTSTKRIAPPVKLPDIARPDAVSWFSGWWHGIAVGVIAGAGLGVTLSSVL